MTRRVSGSLSRRRRREEHGSFVYVLRFSQLSWRRRPRRPIIDAPPAAEPLCSVPAPPAPVQPRVQENA